MYGCGHQRLEFAQAIVRQVRCDANPAVLIGPEFRLAELRDGGVEFVDGDIVGADSDAEVVGEDLPGGGDVGEGMFEGGVDAASGESVPVDFVVDEIDAADLGSDNAANLLALLVQFAGCGWVEVRIGFLRAQNVEDLLAKVEAEELWQESAPCRLAAAWG